MYKKYLNISVIVVLTLFASVQNLAAQKYNVVKDLRNDWQVYDRYYQSYIPLLTNDDRIPSGGIFIQKKSDQDYYISFYSNKGLSIFVENKLVYKHPTNAEPERVHLSLNNINKQAEDDLYLLLFHNPTTFVYLDSLRIETRLPASKMEASSLTKITQLLQFRKGLVDREVFIFMILLFCTVVVFYKFVFMKGRTLINVGLDRNTELLLLDRSGMMSINLILINSILYMMVFYLISVEKPLLFNFPFRTFLEAHTSGYGIYLFCSFVFMQVFKIIYVKIINELTFPSGVSPLQNYLLLNYLFQAGLLVLPVILVVIALMPLSYINSIAESANQIFFIILVIISVLTSYMIYSRSELRNIYLFSYICTAEIVPLIVAYRVLLG